MLYCTAVASLFVLLAACSTTGAEWRAYCHQRVAARREFFNVFMKLEATKASVSLQSTE